MATELAALPRASRREWITVGVVTATFAALLVLTALTTPRFGSPDEWAHTDAAFQLALGYPWSAPGKLEFVYAVFAAIQPVNVVHDPTWAQLIAQFPGRKTDAIDQMSQHPPTFYLIQAGLLHLIGFQHLQWDHALFAMRLLDCTMVAPLPLLAWDAVRRLTRSPRAGLVGAVAVLAVPELVSIGSAVTNDAPVIILGAAVVAVCVRVLTGDHRWRTLVLLGVLLGGVISMKGTGLPMIPFVAVVVLWSTISRSTVVPSLLRTAVVMAVGAAVGGWWWIHNVLVYRTVQPDGFQGRPPKPFPAGQGPDVQQFTTVTWDTLPRTFWGSTGPFASNAISPFVLDIATVLCLVVVIGWAFRRGPQRRAAICLAVLVLVLVLLQTNTTWATYLRTTFIGGIQGRYYYAAIVALIGLSALAWRRLPRTEAGRARLSSALVIAFLVVALYGYWFLYRAFWEGGAIAVTGAGLDRLQSGAMVPAAAPTAVALFAVVVAGAVATVLLTRSTARRRPTATDALETAELHT